jgi:flagellar biosynthesis regulator FlaF
LNKPYGSDSLIDTDMAGYEYDSEEMQPHHLEEDGEESDLKEHINILEQMLDMLEAAAKESSRMQYQVEQLEYEMKGWKELYRRGAGN